VKILAHGIKEFYWRQIRLNTQQCFDFLVAASTGWGLPSSRLLQALAGSVQYPFSIEQLVENWVYNWLPVHKNFLPIAC